MGLTIDVFQPVETFAVSAATPTPGRVKVASGDFRRKLRFASPTGSGDYYIKFGDSTVTAAATDTLVLGGTAEIFTIPAGKTHVSALAATTTVAVNITSGAGS